MLVQQAHDTPVFRNHCTRCNATTDTTFVVVIAVNGAKGLRLRCLTCLRSPDRFDKLYPHSALIPHGIDIDSIIVIDVHKSPVPCERCGSPFAEGHHWAPRAYFDDADLWPMSYLCVPCHLRWHKIMTPGLVGNGRIAAKRCNNRVQTGNHNADRGIQCPTARPDTRVSGPYTTLDSPF